MKNITYLFLALFSLTYISSLAFLTTFYPRVAGQTTTVTIAISRCGDSQIDGLEDCEGLDLNSQTCSSLGFSGGDLACDASCHFDIQDCIVPSPTPTPSPTPILTPTALPLTPTSTPDSPSDTDSDSPQPTPTFISLPVEISVTQKQPLPLPKLTLRTFSPSLRTKLLSSKVSLFDYDHDSKLSLAEFKIAIQNYPLFLQDSRPSLLSRIFLFLLKLFFHLETPLSCDLNNDYYCNLQDLSLLRNHLTL